MEKRLKKNEIIEKIEELQKELLRYNTFDSVIIVKTSATLENVEEIKNKIKELAEVEEIQELGIKKLAYKVKEQSEGFYIESKIICSYNELEKLEQYYRNNNNILKFISIETEE